MNGERPRGQAVNTFVSTRTDPSLAVESGDERSHSSSVKPDREVILGGDRGHIRHQLLEHRLA